jgi:hypothetical protein
MYSINEASQVVGKSYQWVRRRCIRKGLGQKVGWAIVLSNADMVVLLKESGEEEDGSEAIVSDTPADLCAV